MDFEASTSIRLTELFIASGSDLNALVGVWKSNTPLLSAVIQGHPSSLQLLLDAGAKHDCRDSRGRLALTIAVLSGRGFPARYRARFGRCVELLLPSASDTDITEAMVTACKVGTPAALEILMSSLSLVHRACPLDARDAHGDTALTIAARYSDRCVELLLEAGADVNGTNASGWTPLAMNALHGYCAGARTLLEHPHIDVNPVVDATHTRLLIQSGLPVMRSAISFISSAMTPLLIAAVTQTSAFTEILHHGEVDTWMTTTGNARGRLVEEIAPPCRRADILEARRTQVYRSIRGRMAAFRIARFLRDTTCNPMYAAARRSLLRQY